jgi:hypothetical protein
MKRIKAVRPGAGVSMSPGLNPDQLQLLMTGGELMRSITQSSDAYGGESMGEMWKRKEGESLVPNQETGMSLSKSLKTHGYRGNTIKLYHSPGTTEILDGHHRVAAAAALERQGTQIHIPVEHSIYKDEIDTNNWWEL